MAYHMLVADSLLRKNLFFDIYFGSATTIDCYWESVGRELNLPIISSLTEKADSETGFSLSSKDLILFKKELEQFEKYWLDQHLLPDDLPEGFLEKIGAIAETIDKAIANGHVLVVC